ncbi:HEAT repeat domain-containing protein [Calderihabitans maritimus]|uniref:FOG: HEAT repeat n=1 Tax=Calderihabitans maritimus TaxID=1246530 RepID=A0A1Z5HWL0_9FIRM|nr:HEAT repeat domain-containing protein [Calderihabitans maritimus]GAW93705.1 FOG: HEAT repeat [Calderihabitans maritimus]
MGVGLWLWWGTTILLVVGLSLLLLFARSRLKRRNRGLDTVGLAEIIKRLDADKKYAVDLFKKIETPSLLLHHLQEILPKLSDRGKQALNQALEEVDLLKEIIGMLTGPDVESRIKAAEVLGWLANPTAIEPLIEALGDKDPAVSWAAAQALVRLKNPRVIEPLIATLRQPHRWPPARVAEILVSQGSAAVPLLLNALGEADSRTKELIVEILAEIKDPRAETALIGLLREDNVRVRAKAAEALGELGGVSSTNALLKVLEEPSWEIRAGAVKALGKLGGATAEAALKRAAQDTEWRVRALAEAVLASTPDPQRGKEDVSN